MPVTSRAYEGEELPMPRLPVAEKFKRFVPVEDVSLRRSAVWLVTPFTSKEVSVVEAETFCMKSGWLNSKRFAFSAMFQLRSAFGVTLPRSKAKVIGSISFETLSLLIIQSAALVAPPDTTPTSVVAEMVSA